MYGPGDFVFEDDRIGQAIIDGVSGAKQEIVIISPYVKIWNNLERELIAARGKGVSTSLYFRTGKESEIDLGSVARCFERAGTIETLHAKIYRFDDEYLISSMNLYDFSQSSSREIAIRVVDRHAKFDVKAYLDTLLACARPVAPASRPSSPKSAPTPKQAPRPAPVETRPADMRPLPSVMNLQVQFSTRSS